MPEMLRIEPDKCTGCMQCELACSYVKTGQFQPAMSLIRVHIFDEHAAYTPYTCFQCAESWCVTACPVNAIATDPDTGAKAIVEAACVGCSLCTIACPFGTVFLNPISHVAMKCDLCGGDPACVRACPTDCLAYADADNSALAGAWTGKLAKQVQAAHAEAYGDA
jgi:Fe-S-cluster-containing hydrogenase component 2